MRLRPNRIGLIEDDPIMGASIMQRLELENLKAVWWKSGKEALAGMGAGDAGLDVVVCDIRLPDMSGEDIFRKLAGERTHPPFMFITGFGEIDQAVRLMRLGASDYVTKPFVMDEFLMRVRQNLSGIADGISGQAPVLGISPAMRKIEETITQYAQTRLPVLITGETGVGKELCANLLHQQSGHKTGPVMAVNCAAIPAELLESEIFGHEKGAFSGASRRHLGYAERAGNGTLFLDEIGDMPLALQAKLLRLIDQRQFTRLGGEEMIPFKACIVAATHHDLTDLIRQKRFREDLYFRLSVLPLHIPPLRSRTDDIPWLLDRLVEDACRRQDKETPGLSSAAEEASINYTWPGNVREMRNRVERAIALGNSGWITPQDLFPDLAVANTPTEAFSTLQDARDTAEKRQIERALAKTGGQIIGAAKLLGISRTTLWEKMNRLGIGDSGRSEN